MDKRGWTKQHRGLVQKVAVGPRYTRQMNKGGVRIIAITVVGRKIKETTQ
jgi:hypothetical protein